MSSLDGESSFDLMGNGENEEGIKGEAKRLFGEKTFGRLL